MNIIKKIWLLIFFSLLTACGSNTPGLNELKKLCEKDAGLTIYKTVEADGYYDATRKGDALWVLIPSNYSFIEFCNLDPNKPSFNEPGCWRMTKVSREIGQCNETVDKSLMRNGSDASRKFRKKKCIDVEKVDKPQAEHMYEVEKEEWWINESTGTKMTSGTGRIINNKTGEVLGEGKNYVLFPKWYGSGRSLPSIHCGSSQITGLQKTIPFAAGLIEKTLIPEIDESTGESK